MNGTNGAGKTAAEWTHNFEMVVSRRRKLLGFAGISEWVKIGLYTDARGYRRRVELVRLGNAGSIEQALGLATLGMLGHPAGTRQYLRYSQWAERLLATQRVIAECDARYRRRVAEMASGLPYHEPRRPVAVLHATGTAGRDDGSDPPPAAA